MSVLFTEKSNEEEWEAFLRAQHHPPFLQSWHMRHVHTRMTEETIPIAIRRSDAADLVGCALGSVVRARRGHYLYFPYGPVIVPELRNEIFPLFTRYSVARGRDLRVDFLRSSPFWDATPQHASMYRSHGWRRSPIHMLAEHTWLLDIRPSEQELLAQMRKTTRNLIHQAQRKNIMIHWSDDVKDLEDFFTIQRDTVARHKFVPYKENYVRAQVEAFRATANIGIVKAVWQNAVVAVAIVMFYGDMASYHHAASRTATARIPVSYELQWHAIQEAKRRGCSTYNFWGIVPPEKLHSPVLHRPHPFAGVTTFKTGFGGVRADLLPCHDYPLTARYHLTRTIETIRRYRRGFF